MGDPVSNIACPPGAFCGEVTCIGIDPGSGLAQCDASKPMFFSTGSSQGISTEWNLDVARRRLKPGICWPAHVAPLSQDALFSGVTAVGLDGRSVVTGGADSSACLWYCTEEDDGGTSEYTFPRAERRLHGAHGGAVTAVAPAAPLGQAITGGQDGSVRFWSPKVDSVLPKHQRDRTDCAKGPSTVTGLMLDTKNHRVCSGSEDGFVRMWDVAVGRPTRRLAHTVRGALSRRPRSRWDRGGVQTVAFDCGAALTQLVSGAADGSWCVWDVRQAEPVTVVAQSHLGPVSAIAVRDDRVLSASLDGAAYLWDIRWSPPSPLEVVSMLGLLPPAPH